MVQRFKGEQIAKLIAQQNTIVLRRGQSIELRSQLPVGAAWPESFRPEVYFDKIQHRLQMMRQPSNRKLYAADAPELDFGMLVELVKPGVFTIRLAEDTPPFFVGIHSPGFLQFFDAGPFTKADAKDGVLTVQIPRPAALHIHFDVPDDIKTLPFNNVGFSVLRRIPGSSNAYLFVASESNESAELDATISDLAPGEYRTSIQTTAKPDVKPLASTEVNPACSTTPACHS